MKSLMIASVREFSSIIQRADTALTERNFDLFIDTFREIWTDISRSPDFSNLPHEADLYRQAGEFLVHYGKAYNLISYQSRGKDLLTKAIDLFHDQQQPEEALNAQVVLAYAYYQEGAKDEYEAFLLDAESSFTGDKDHINYLKVQLNLLIYELESAKLEEANQRITDNFSLFQRSNNLKVKTQFFIEAGIISRRLALYSNAYMYFDEALQLCQQLNNNHYEALVYNNAANTYRSDKRYEEAHRFVDRAIELASKQDGWRANFLDTKALIYFDQEDFENAEFTINESISLFRCGDDYGGLCEALWNKTKILVRLDLRELAFETFIECHQTASLRISYESASFYLMKMMESTFFLSSGNLFEQVNSVKRQLIEKALISSNGKVTEAAKTLGIDHRALSAMMKNFPSIYSDLGIKRKNRRVSSKKNC